VQGQTARPDDGYDDAVSDDDAFVFGCDCFDAGCYFEAHEQWERPWLAAKARGDDDDEAVLHGLIRLAAAGVKLLARQPDGVRAHVDGARGHFDRVGRFTRGLSRDIVDGVADALLRGQRPELP
jgi:hypothetical protein